MWLEIVLWATGIALSPTVTIMVIFLLLSSRPRANAGAMAAGWVLSLTAVALLAFVLVLVFRVSGGGQPDPAIEVLRVVLGVLLFAAGGVLWWRAKKHGPATDLSRLTGALDSVTPRRSFLLGVAVGDLKAFILTIAAASAVAGEPHSAPLLVVVLLVFVLIASLGVLLPTGFFWLKGDDADDTLRRWRDRLEGNTKYAMVGVSLAFGAALLGRGIAGLAGEGHGEPRRVASPRRRRRQRPVSRPPALRRRSSPGVCRRL